MPRYAGSEIPYERFAADEHKAPFSTLEVEILSYIFGISMQDIFPGNE